MASKNKGWNADEMQGTLISDMEREVKEGISLMKSGAQPPLQAVHGNGDTAGEQPTSKGQTVTETKPQEPTKGVQTYIPMSMFRRLTDVKLSRGETVANLVAEAIAIWLDVQEGKAVVQQTAP